ncbi:hypothetical protein DOY81_008708 [Sarcophaga bullata]|nr:hypothetical protein DOY81_008708 [Sarcophaga bullata]
MEKVESIRTRLLEIPQTYPYYDENTRDADVRKVLGITTRTIVKLCFLLFMNDKTSYENYKVLL